MNKYDFTNLVKEPEKLGDAEIEKLKALLNQFPYFAIAGNLLVKALHNTNHYEYDKYLKQAALRTGNRSVLYNLVHGLPTEIESGELPTPLPGNFQLPVSPIEIEAKEILNTTQIENNNDSISFSVETEEVNTANNEITIQDEPDKVEKEVEEIVLTQELTVDNSEIRAEEKLVEPSGEFFRFIPDQEEQESTVSHKPEPIPVSPVEFSKPLEEEVLLEVALTLPEIIISPEIDELGDTNDGITNPASHDFLSWISKKGISDNPTEPEAEKTILTEPVRVQILEDSEFVKAFNRKMKEHSVSMLNLEVQSHLPKKLTSELVQPPDIVEKTIVLQNLEMEIGPNKMLQSLAEYDVNQFLAPLYVLVTYNDKPFEDSFNAVYDGQKPDPAANKEPFVSLKPTEKEKATPPEFKLHESQEILPKTAHIQTPQIPRNPGSVESILDKFIRENPSITRQKSEFYNPMNMAKYSAEEDDEIVSETLAQIYTRQGLHKKAIGMYEKLGLQFPEKLPYFAGLISKIKSEHNIE